MSNRKTHYWVFEEDISDEDFEEILFSAVRSHFKTLIFVQQTEQGFRLLYEKICGSGQTVTLIELFRVDEGTFGFVEPMGWEYQRWLVLRLSSYLFEAQDGFYQAGDGAAGLHVRSDEYVSFTSFLDAFSPYRKTHPDYASYQRSYREGLVALSLNLKYPLRIE